MCRKSLAKQVVFNIQKERRGNGLFSRLISAIGNILVNAAGGAPLIRQLGGQLAQIVTAFAFRNPEQLSQFSNESGFLLLLNPFALNCPFQGRSSIFRVRRCCRLRRRRCIGNRFFSIRRRVACGWFSFRCRRRRWLRSVFLGNVLVQRAGAIQVYAAVGVQAVKAYKAVVTWYGIQSM